MADHATTDYPLQNESFVRSEVASAIRQHHAMIPEDDVLTIARFVHLINLGYTSLFNEQLAEDALSEGEHG